MKPRDPLAAIALLLLVGSVLFLASGAAAWFLRSEQRPHPSLVERSADRQRAPTRPATASEASGTSHDVAVTPDRILERAASQSALDPLLVPQLLPQLLIEGRIVDASGQPLDQATVSLELRLDSRPAGLSESRARSTRTAADGRFAFLGAAPDRSHLWITLVAHAVGQAPQLVQREVENAADFVDVGDLALAAGGSLAGRIIDALGSPVSHATAALQPVAGHPLEGWSDRAEILPPAAADGAGYYAFPNLMPGAYRVTATAPGMQEGSLREAAFVEEGRDIEVAAIRLVPGGELTGRVLAPDDAPVPAATVHVRGSGAGNRFEQRITTDADGRFHADHLPPGLLQLDAAAAGFAAAPRVEVDAATAGEVVLRLAPGLSVRGVVVVRSSGAPVERFAATLRAIGRSELAAPDTASRVLERRIQSLRNDAAAATDPSARARSESAALDLESRLQALGTTKVATAPRRATAAASALVDHPHGRFEFSGLDEGVYAVDVVPADERSTSIAPIEVRRGIPVPELRVEVEPGFSVSGQVVAKADGAPIAGATIELVAVDDATSSDAARATNGAPFSWAFAAPGAHGVALLATRSDERGRFELRQAPPGRCFLSVTHETSCRQKTEPFDLRGDRDDFRIALAACASLRGRVRGIPAGLERDVTVLAVGGFGALRTVKVGAGGDYRIERLQPGAYVVRALFASAGDALDRQVAAIFAEIFEEEHAPTAPDLTLAEGELGELDLTLDLPAVGAVEGTLLVNGQPAPGFTVVMRSAAGVANSARVSLRRTPDQRGQFALRNVRPGDYTLQVFSASSRQELHRQAITVAADASTRVDARVAVGGLRGRILADDGAPPERLDGTLTILPGATVAPADVRQYGETHRVHTVRVRGGLFQVEHLTAGAALVIVEMRGREPVESSIDIPVRTTLDAVLPAGKAR